MKTRNFAIAAHIALLAGLTATCFGAAAADKDADDQTPVTKSQPQKAHVETMIKIDPGIAGSTLPQAKTPGLGTKPVVPNFSGAAMQRIGEAVEIEQVRDLQAIQEMQNAIEEMRGAGQDIQNLGAIDDPGGPLRNRGQNDPLGKLGRQRDSGGGQPDYVTNNPYGPPNATDPDAGKPNRSSPYSGGALMPPSPRDIARGGGIAGYGWGAGNDYGERQANGNITYTEVTHHSDGSRTVNNSTYDVYGNLRSAHQRSFDSEGNVTHIWHGDVVYPEDGGDPTMRTSWTNLKDGQVETLDRAHEPVGDPPLRDPDVDIAGTPVDDPYASGGGDGYCPPYLPGCQREGKPRQSPNRVNPGDPDQVDTPQAPRLVVNSESLVTNPDPTGSPGSGFSPPAGWQEDIEGGGKTPGAMPPRDGRGAP